MKKVRRRPSRVSPDDIANTLSRDIVEGRVPPGLRLDEGELAARFETSRTPVREAISRLVALGLVEKTRHRGATVRVVDPASVAELFEVMAELEACSARLAALRMTGAERAVLRAHHRATGLAVREGDREAYAAANRIFHRLIYEGAHNGALMAVTREVRARVAPYRTVQFKIIGRLSSSFEEHETIVEAIEKADGDGAASLMRRHISRVSDASDEFVRGVAYRRDRL